MILTQRTLNRALLARQLLLAREPLNPLDAIDRLAGMQAQRPQPPFVGLWTRLSNFRREDLIDLLRRRQVVRVTMMRGTLHLMTSRQYLAFRPLLQPALSAGMESILRERTAGFDRATLVRAAKECFEEQPRTFTDLRAALLGRFPDSDERAMGYMVRTHLPLVVVPEEVEWGFRADGNFATADQWLQQIPREAAGLEDLIKAYLAAFGPAAPADMQAWSALTKLKEAFESLRPHLAVFHDEKKRELFDLPESPRPDAETPAAVRFIPAFDNLILAHADRTRIIDDAHRPRVVSKNLQVAATFLVDGFVAGVWDTAIKKNVATMQVTPFAKLGKSVQKELSEEGERLLRFLAPDASEYEVKFG